MSTTADDKLNLEVLADFTALAKRSIQLFVDLAKQEIEKKIGRFLSSHNSLSWFSQVCLILGGFHTILSVFTACFFLQLEREAGKPILNTWSKTTLAIYSTCKRPIGT